MLRTIKGLFFKVSSNLASYEDLTSSLLIIYVFFNLKNIWKLLIKENKEPIKYICFVENGNKLLTIYEKKLIYWEIKAN